MNVAAFLNENGEIVDFYEDGKIRLFEKIADCWQESKAIPMSLKREMGIAGVRVALAETFSQLGDCEVFLVRELRGILKVFLEEMACRV